MAKRNQLIGNGMVSMVVQFRDSISGQRFDHPNWKDDKIRSGSEHMVTIVEDTVIVNINGKWNNCHIFIDANEFHNKVENGSIKILEKFSNRQEAISYARSKRYPREVRAVNKAFKVHYKH